MYLGCSLFSLLANGKGIQCFSGFNFIRFLLRSDSLIGGYLMCRAKFSPYEADWWECTCSRSETGEWKGYLKILSEKTPVIWSQNELAREISNQIHNQSCKWFWRTVNYTVSWLKPLVKLGKESSEK